MKLTLIRHTRVEVPVGTCYGNSDVDVAETFPEEAKKVKEGLAGKRFDAVYSSPLQRCTKLAAYCGFSDPVLDNRLKELNFGRWEGKRWEEIEDPRLQEWYDNWLSVSPMGGESFLDQYNRVSSFLDELKENPFREVCIFAHGGTIQAILIYAGVYNFNQAFSNDITYGSRTIVEID